MAAWTMVRWRLLPDFHRPNATGWSAIHAARVDPADARVGDFPLECGRWAPDAFDAELEIGGAVTCKACLKAIRARRRKGMGR